MWLRFRRRVTPVMLLGLVVIAGCSSGQSAAPVQDPDPAPATATAALGDPRTVDPCSLTEAGRWDGFGEVTEAGTVSLDYCLQHVRTGDGSLVQLAVGELSEASPVAAGDPVVQRGSLRIVQNAPTPGHCSRQVLFADGVSMRVSSDSLTGASGAGLCGLAQAGAEAAVDAIEQHRVGHRSVPPDSLALLDPCTVLDSAMVQRMPGLQGSPPQSSPSRHQCQWGEQEAQSPRVRLMHTAGDPPKVLHGAAVRERIAGRETVVSMVGGDPRTPLCSAETPHLPFGERGSGQLEVAMLVVAVPGATGIQACEFTRGLAEHAWPRLPHA